MTYFKLFSSISLMFTVLVFNSCGPKAPEPPNASSRGDADANHAGTIISAVPTSSYYDALLAKEFKEATTGGFMLAGGSAPIVYLNFFGGEVSQGYGAGESFLLCSKMVSFPSAEYTTEEVSFIEEGVRSHFAEGQTPIEFTQIQPTNGDYTTIYIGGSYQDLGCRTGEKLQGAAPYDIGNINPSDTGFVFTDSMDKTEDELAVTIEVIANTFGLKQDQIDISGIPEVMEESLAGVDELRSMGRLLWKVDPATIIDISPMQQELDALVPGDIELENFDKIITATLGAAQSNDTEQQQSGGSGGLGTLFDGFANIINDVDPNTVAAVATLAGHPEIAVAAEVLIPVVQSQTSPDDPSGQSSEKNQSLVPDYATMLGLRSINSMPDLIGNFWAHMDIVNEEYSGEDMKALRSLLIVAYSQVYRDNVSFGDSN